MPRPRVLASRLKSRLDASKKNAHCIITAELIVQAAGYVEEGLPLDAVEPLLGLGRGVLWTWKKRGERWEAVGMPAVSEDAPYGMLMMELRAAFARYRLKMTRNLHFNSVSWVQWLAILERRDRANYGRTAPQGGADEEYDPDERFD